MSKFRLKVDIRSGDNGGQLLAKAGDVVEFIRMDGNYNAVAQTQDGRFSFPLEDHEYTIIDTDQHVMHESAPDPETVIHMSRGKTAKPR